MNMCDRARRNKSKVLKRHVRYKVRVADGLTVNLLNLDQKQFSLALIDCRHHETSTKCVFSIPV